MATIISLPQGWTMREDDHSIMIIATDGTTYHYGKATSFEVIEWDAWIEYKKRA